MNIDIHNVDTVYATMKVNPDGSTYITLTVQGDGKDEITLFSKTNIKIVIGDEE